jgi:hypothetical protein
MITSFTLVGTGAMNSPRYRPAGLIVRWSRRRVMLDGGGDATPEGPIDDWLVSDDRAELMPDIRARARALGVQPRVASWQGGSVAIRPQPVVHTAHPTYGYRIELPGRTVVWAPEFLDFPDWAAGADLMFADAAGWQRPIRFAGGVGGHACVLAVADAARRYGVRRLVFAHIGRPSIRARDVETPLPYGEWGCEGREYRVRFSAPDGPPLNGLR